MKEMKMFRLKPSRLGTVEIRLRAEAVKTFYMPDGDGWEFRKVLEKIEKGDNLYLCFETLYEPTRPLNSNRVHIKFGRGR
jgi:hypothetical protein